MTRSGILLAFVSCLLLASCSTRPPPGPKSLIVGTTADYEPMLWQKDGRLMGAEADLLQMLAGGLNRPLQFVVLSEEECVGALMTGEVNILAGGLTLEKAERWRVNTTEPFLQSGQMAVCPREKSSEFNSVKRLKNSGVAIGVRKGATAERVVAKQLPKSNIVTYPDSHAAVMDLAAGRRISLYVDDAPVIWKLMQSGQHGMFMLPAALSTDLYVWGVNPADPVLRAQIDELLQRWRKDGTLHAVLKKWLPIAGR